MRTRLFHSLHARFLVALASVLLQPGARAGQVFFTTVPTLSPSDAVSASQTNPVINPPTASFNLYMWAKLAPPTRFVDNSNPSDPIISYRPGERIVSMGLDLTCVVDGSGGAAGSDFTVNGTFAGGTSDRWDGPINSTSQPNTSVGRAEYSGPEAALAPNSNVIHRFSRFAVAGLGLTDMIHDATLDDNAGNVVDQTPGSVLGTDGNVYVRFATLPITITGSPNRVDFFIKTNSLVFAESAGNDKQVFFGAGDAAVNGSDPGGVGSTLPDAVWVVPEPMSIVLLPVLLPFASRRRRA